MKILSVLDYLPTDTAIVAYRAGVDHAQALRLLKRLKRDTPNAIEQSGGRGGYRWRLTR